MLLTLFGGGAGSRPLESASRRSGSRPREAASPSGVLPSRSSGRTRPERWRKRFKSFGRCRPGSFRMSAPPAIFCPATRRLRDVGQLCHRHTRYSWPEAALHRARRFVSCAGNSFIPVCGCIAADHARGRRVANRDRRGYARFVADLDARHRDRRLRRKTSCTGGSRDRQCHPGRLCRVRRGHRWDARACSLFSHRLDRNAPDNRGVLFHPARCGICHAGKGSRAYGRTGN